jgi:hypothetical protein
MEILGMFADTKAQTDRQTDRAAVRKHEQSGTLGRPRHRWENNIRKDFKEIDCEGLD